MHVCSINPTAQVRRTHQFRLGPIAVRHLTNVALTASRDANEEEDDDAPVSVADPSEGNDDVIPVGSVAGPSGASSSGALLQLTLPDWSSDSD